MQRFYLLRTHVDCALLAFWLHLAARSEHLEQYTWPFESPYLFAEKRKEPRMRPWELLGAPFYAFD